MSDKLPAIIGDPWTTDDVIRGLPHNPDNLSPLPAPIYLPDGDCFRKPRVALAVSSMKHHMTDEGWQIMLGLRSAGWNLYGHKVEGGNITSVPQILSDSDPGVVLVQDKREWDAPPRDFREQEARFKDVGVLTRRPDIFRLTVLKDAQQKPRYHMESAQEIGCHAWLVYYHPRIVHHLAPYTRPQHLIRTWHTLDADLVNRVAPVLRPSRERRNSVVSGAVSGAYPLRERIVRNLDAFPGMIHLAHPGYHRHGCATGAYLEQLSCFKVSICTASKYGYALRKIVESTAVGCRVITDLPVDEFVSGIDDNLIRVRPDISTPLLKGVIQRACEEWDLEFQTRMSEQARVIYDYKHQGGRLNLNILCAQGDYNRPANTQ